MKFFHRKQERRKPENAMKRKRFDQAQKQAVLQTLASVQETTRKTDERIEELRRIARLGNL